MQATYEKKRRGPQLRSAVRQLHRPRNPHIYSTAKVITWVLMLAFFSYGVNNSDALHPILPNVIWAIWTPAVLIWWFRPK